MWSVVIHKQSDQEHRVLDKFNTKANAQLFAENYAWQFVVQHDGLNANESVATRKQIEAICNNESIVKENRHFIIRNKFPWGLSVVNLLIRQLETTKVDEIEVTETLEVDAVVKVSKQVTVPGRLFGSRTHTVQEEQTIKVPKQVQVKKPCTSTTYQRLADVLDVFTVSIAYDPSSQPEYVQRIQNELENRISTEREDRAKCFLLADRVRGSTIFKLLETNSLSTLKHICPAIFDTYRSYLAVRSMGKLLNQLQSDKKNTPKPFLNPFDTVDNRFLPPISDFWGTTSTAPTTWTTDGLRRRTNIPRDLPKDLPKPQPGSTPEPDLTDVVIDAPAPSTPPTPPPPPKHKPMAALAHLNNDILAKHREMFGSDKPKSGAVDKSSSDNMKPNVAPKSGKESGKEPGSFDDETIENLCNEIQRAIHAAGDELPELSSDSDYDSESESESDAESESESDSDSDWDSEPEPLVSGDFIFEPREISP